MKTLAVFAISFFCFILGRYSKEPDAYSTSKKIKYLSETDEPVIRTGNSLDIISLINSERNKSNLSYIKSDMNLFCAAQQYTKELAKKGICASETADYFLIRSRKCGIPSIIGAQTIACGESLGYRVVKTWMATGNRKVLMNPEYTKIGCDEKNGFWVCVFSSEGEGVRNEPK